MSPFKFSLESVLKVREKAEAAAQENHAAAVRQAGRVEAELREAQAELEELSAKLERMQRQSFRPGDRALFWNAMAYQKDFCQRLAEKLERAHEEAQASHTALLAARRDN